MEKSIRSSDAVPLILAYWTTATGVSLVSLLIYGGSDNAAAILVAPLFPLIPLIAVVAYGLAPSANSVPTGVVLCILLYPVLFISLVNITRRYSLRPTHVGITGGIINGVIAGACVFAMIRSM